MKCDADFNLLCIKYTKQTFAFPTLEIAPRENCFQQRLRVCISLVTGLLCLSSGSKLSSFISPPPQLPCQRATAQSPSCSGLRWAVLPSTQAFLGRGNSHSLGKTVVYHTNNARYIRGQLQFSQLSMGSGLHLVLIMLYHQVVLVCISHLCKSHGANA